MTTETNNKEKPTLEVSKLTKRYAGRKVLDNIELKLPASALVGLLGPNGAGKTTLLRSLAGLIRPDEGHIKIAGYDLQQQEALARGQLAYVPDVPHFYTELTAWEHLELTARAFKMGPEFAAKAEKLMRWFGLWEARHSPPFTFSRGMSQKLALCCGFVRPSKLMLLDEPGGTLDIKSVGRLYKLLENYREQGGLAILSSHQWETLQNLCDMFVMVDQGQVLAAGDLTFLRDAAGLSDMASLREVYLTFMEADDAALPDENYEDWNPEDEIEDAPVASETQGQRP